MGLAGYGPVPEPGYYFEFYATSTWRARGFLTLRAVGYTAREKVSQSVCGD